MIVGMLREARFRSVTVELEPEEALLLYTDGVTEARVDGELLGAGRLAAMLGDCVDMTAQAITERIEQFVLEYLDGRPHDDIALLALRAEDRERNRRVRCRVRRRPYPVLGRAVPGGPGRRRRGRARRARPRRPGRPDLRRARPPRPAGGRPPCARRFPPMAAYDAEQHARTVEDLGHILDFLATALYLDDVELFHEFVGRLGEILTARGVPAAAVRLGLDALDAVLGTAVGTAVGTAAGTAADTAIDTAIDAAGGDWSRTRSFLAGEGNG